MGDNEARMLVTLPKRDSQTKINGVVHGKGNQCFEHKAGLWFRRKGIMSVQEKESSLDESHG